jgi:hypothetical protein
MGLAFHLRRDRTLAAPGDITAIREIVHGTILLAASRLTLRWWIDRVTDRFGRDIRTADRKPPSPNEATIAIAHLARVDLRRDPWWRRPRGARLVLEVEDPRAFAALVGPNGLLDADATTLAVGVGSRDYDAGRELAAELGIAIGDLALEATSEPTTPPPADDPS